MDCSSSPFSVYASKSDFNASPDNQAKGVADYPAGATIRVIGVGGGGSNAVAHMIKNGLKGVDCLCTNTDAQALKIVVEETGASIYQLGLDVTRGLGAGANPERGKLAAEADKNAIHQMLDGADMVFITAGMGGGTGTGAAPVIASIARKLGILTVAIVTRPFGFEGKKRSAIADAGLEALLAEVDALITIPNEKLLTALSRKISLKDAFNEANDVLLNSVQGISELITSPGMINLDFADITTVMKKSGVTMMGIGEAEGEQRASKAVNKAVNSPLLEDLNLKNATGILINITADEGFALGELSEVSDFIAELAASDANVIIGTSIDPAMGDRLRVTVVATGLERKTEEEIKASPVKTRVVHQAVKRVEPPITTASKKLNQEIDHYMGDSKEVMLATNYPPKSPEETSKSYQVRYDQAMVLLDIPTFLRKQAGVAH